MGAHRLKRGPMRHPIDRSAGREPESIALVFADQSGDACVISYFCIVNLPGSPVRDIHVIDAPDDAAARRGLADVASRWPGFETVALYHGERVVMVAGNPHWGLASVEDPEHPGGGLAEAA